MIKTIATASPDKSAIFPFYLENWRRLIVRFDLNTVKDFPEWPNITHELTTRLIDTPEQLALFSYSDALTSPLLFEDDTIIMRLWPAACIGPDAQNRAPYKVPYGTNAKLIANPSGLKHWMTRDCHVHTSGRDWPLTSRFPSIQRGPPRRHGSFLSEKIPREVYKLFRPPGPP